ncbi:YjbH domain-containing protein [Candidatus Fermentibacterales bacterium]|nr:YjbH domain-containing protein [Candidatus Fermentibacterales bacterium]
MRTFVSSTLLAVTTGLFSAAGTRAGSLPFARSGVLDSPDAYILRHTEVEMELSAAAYTVADTSGGSDSEFALTGHIDIGLFDYGQIGVSYLADGGISGSVKLSVIRESVTVPAFAVGLENITGEKYIEHFKQPDGSFYPYDHQQNWSAYGVVSKDFRYLIGVPVTLSVGIGLGRFVGVIDNGSLGIGSRLAHGAFASLVYEPGERFDIILEEDGRDFNLGLRYEVSPLFTVEIAWAEFEKTLFPAETHNPADIMQNSKFSFGLYSRFGPLFGARRLELEREQQRIQRARARLRELEERRRAAEEELQRLMELLESD